MVVCIKSFRVFIPEPEWSESHRILEEVAEVIVGKHGVRYDEEALAEVLKDFDAVIITSQHKVSRRVIYSSPRLKVIAKYGSKPGPDNVDLEAATERGIPVVYSPEANSDSVAEFTVSLILCVLKKICFLNQALRQGLWRSELLIEKSNFTRELKEKVVGVVGLGAIGRRVARILQSFGVRLIGYDPYVQREALGGIHIVMVGSLDELLRESDIVTIHAALSPVTYHMMGERELRLMKPTAYLINTARGAIVDEQALVRALKEGWIAGAALDVFEKEPLPKDHPLLQLSNVIATPHFASCTYEAYERETVTAHKDVVRVLMGCRPVNIANPEVLGKRPDLRECQEFLL
ncbi:MAG: hydroxyacid dehydrogenase [Zestosphaera sp.]